jgi:hypothetical protein
MFLSIRMWYVFIFIMYIIHYSSISLYCVCSYCLFLLLIVSEVWCSYWALFENKFINCHHSFSSIFVKYYFVIYMIILFSLCDAILKGGGGCSKDDFVWRIDFRQRGHHKVQLLGVFENTFSSGGVSERLFLFLSDYVCV